MAHRPLTARNILTAENFCSLITFITPTLTPPDPLNSLLTTGKNPPSLNFTVLTMGFFQLATRAQALAMKAMGATLKYIKDIT